MSPLRRTRCRQQDDWLSLLPVGAASVPMRSQLWVCKDYIIHTYRLSIGFVLASENLSWYNRAALCERSTVFRENR
jgi:hypothetical protein